MQRHVRLRPERHITSTAFTAVEQIAYDPIHDVLYLTAPTNTTDPISVLANASTATGAVSAARTLKPGAPFTKISGARVFPALVPTEPGDPAIPANRAAWETLDRWDKPFLTLFAKNDPILGRADRMLQAHVPAAKDQPHERFWGGHFVQEDRDDHLAKSMVAWLRNVCVHP